MNLKELRNIYGYTLRELSDLSGVPIRTIQKHEDGDAQLSNMTARSALGLCEALGLTLYELLHLDEIQMSEEDFAAVKEQKMSISDFWENYRKRK